MSRKSREQYKLTVTLELTFHESLTYGQVKARVRDFTRPDLALGIRELLSYEDTIKWKVADKQLEKRTVY